MYISSGSPDDALESRVVVETPLTGKRLQISVQNKDQSVSRANKSNSDKLQLQRPHYNTHKRS